MSGGFPTFTLHHHELFTWHQKSIIRLWYAAFKNSFGIRLTSSSVLSGRKRGNGKRQGINACSPSPVTAVPSFSSHLIVQTSLVPSSVPVCQPDLDSRYVPAHLHSHLELCPSIIHPYIHPYIHLLLLNPVMGLQTFFCSSFFRFPLFFVLIDESWGNSGIFFHIRAPVSA